MKVGPALRTLKATFDDGLTRARAQVQWRRARRAYAAYGETLRASYGAPTLDHVVSQLSTADQLDSARFLEWCEALHLNFRHHRKWWEFAWIAQALTQHGCLAPGRRGVGFGVGKEPLASYFAKVGCSILATDAPLEQEKGWATANEHASELSALNERGICDDATFVERVTFRPVDMNRIPADITGYDFCWSACAFEHLGSLDHGLAFVERSLDCLVPGGIAVHTTEFNLSSDDATVEHPEIVVYRRRDIEAFAARLRAKGHRIELNLNPGDRELDRYVDLPPYCQDPHVKLLLRGFVSTSIGLLVQKG